MRRRLAALLLLPPIALAMGCGMATPPPPSATLPADAVTGAEDPTRAAILNTASVFPRPDRVAGRPDQAAVAVAQLEHIASELAQGGRWAGFAPLVVAQLGQARQEVRQVIGLSPAASPQAVVDGMYAASRALRAGDRAAAEQALTPIAAGGAAAPVLQRLAALPSMPQAAFATSQAQEELNRQDRGRDRGDMRI